MLLIASDGFEWLPIAISTSQVVSLLLESGTADPNALVGDAASSMPLLVHAMASGAEALAEVRSTRTSAIRVQFDCIGGQAP